VSAASTIDLQDSDTSKDHSSYVSTNEQTSRCGTGESGIGHAYRIRQSGSTAIVHQIVIACKPVLYILDKIKNALLMIPAGFIFCVISFVSYCTLGLALPYRYQQASENGQLSVQILSCILGFCFVCTALLTLASFVRCVFTSSKVADNPPSTSSANINDDTTRTCSKCQQYKPTRAHHCSICSSCTLKMDHHCPWVSNCVGYWNYKYFCLFVWLATLSCHLSSMICFGEIFAIFTHEKSTGKDSVYNGVHSAWLMINSLLTLAFGITLTCFSAFHLVLVLKGATTIEFGGDDYHIYNLGYKRNFYAIFGEDCLYWFLPIPTMNGDGYEYQHHDEDHGLLSHDKHQNTNESVHMTIDADENLDSNELSDFSDLD